MVNKDYKKLILSSRGSNGDFANFEDSFCKDLVADTQIEMGELDQNFRIHAKVPKYNEHTTNFLVGCLFRE